MIKALVVTNMYPSPERPASGVFVRDQVLALKQRKDVELELFAFEGGASNYLRAARILRKKYKGQRFDVVHAHFGLTAWPALLARLGPVAVTLHGTDLFHPRSRAITRAALPFVALAATVSEDLQQQLPASNSAKRRLAVLPCGVDLQRFRPIPRAEARQYLGLDPQRPYVLFPADPSRPGKRFDRAKAVAGDTTMLTLGNVSPQDVPYYINAANAVLVPSEAEGFGLATLEALACNVPVLAAPVGIHPEALNGIQGTLCSPWNETHWRAALIPHITEDDPRIDGRARAALYSATQMAEKVFNAWNSLR